MIMFMWFMLLVFPVFAQQSNSACRDNAGKSGGCKLANNCPTVQRILREVNNQGHKFQLLKQIYCRGSRPLEFCCVDQVNTFPSIRFPTLTNVQKTHNTQNTGECGRLASAPFKVFNGKPIQINSHPWLAAIGRKSNDFSFSVKCGGSLISNRHVLTAAHCFPGINNPTDVRIGEYDLDEPDREHQDFKVLRYVNGPFELKKRVVNGDISLVLLDKTVIYTASVQPICLPSPNLNTNNLIGKKVTVVGWGRTESGFQPNIPHEAKIPIVSLNDCKLHYGDELTNKHLCAGQGNQDSCNGDSGGPLIYNSNEDYKYYAIGIVSFGSKMCGTGVPGVYTKVTSWLSWINQNMNQL